ncbi:unnamed protein product [Gordionus sp. m RMFG-2023]|uniref:N-acyl-phosphatidylethanolamine-hydrolyzing phospholipase D-like isoform X2 n=1 Tax=Gordionus sp. m RMFG-2023 TaxID=3053472 RepID=UPI0030E37079
MERLKEEQNDNVISADLYHPMILDERFHNSWLVNDCPNIIDLLKWKLFGNDKSCIPDKKILDETLPIIMPYFINNLTELRDHQVEVTWLGHSTLLIYLDGIFILTDPIFSEYSSPIAHLGPKRYRKIPCTVEQLPNIHAVIISHSHFDHLDLPSIKDLHKKFGMNLKWFVPKNMKCWLIENAFYSDITYLPLIFIKNKSNDSKSKTFFTNIYDMTWWQREKFSFTSKENIQIEFTLLPAQHWCKRTLNDENKMLWGSWAIKSRHPSSPASNKSVYFAGDTGFHAPLFEQISRLMGPFDFCAIPIGAYEPRWLTKYNHVNPEEAVEIHKILKSRRSLAIHWGTFVMTDEFYLEPRDRLEEIKKQLKMSPDEFFTLKHGETKILD